MRATENVSVERLTLPAASNVMRAGMATAFQLNSPNLYTPRITRRLTIAAIVDTWNQYSFVMCLRLFSPRFVRRKIYRICYTNERRVCVGMTTVRSVRQPTGQWGQL